MRDGHTEFLKYHYGDAGPSEINDIEILKASVERLENKVDTLLVEIKKLNTL